MARNMALSAGSFYPRLREGGDTNPKIAWSLAFWFLPTPPRGRRHIYGDASKEDVEFLPTPPRGRRHHSAKIAPPFSRFYPRLREGGDRLRPLRTK